MISSMYVLREESNEVQVLKGKSIEFEITVSCVTGFSSIDIQNPYKSWVDFTSLPADGASKGKVKVVLTAPLDEGKREHVLEFVCLEKGLDEGNETLTVSLNVSVRANSEDEHYIYIGNNISRVLINAHKLEESTGNIDLSNPDLDSFTVNYKDGKSVFVMFENDKPKHVVEVEGRVNFISALEGMVAYVRGKISKDKEFLDNEKTKL